MVFSKAGPAEILRASQKDEFVIQKLQQMVLDLFLRLGGARITIHNKTLIDCIGYLLYYASTTLSGLQTIGEEYTGILQVNKSLKTMPPFWARLLMILLDCFGALGVIKLFNILEKKLDEIDSLRPIAKAQLLEVIRVLKAIVPFVSHLHKALFYLYWGTYHIAKRITGIHYVLVRYWLKDRESLFGFRILGILTLIHLTAFSIHSVNSWRKGCNQEAERDQRQFASGPTASGTQKCSLCLDLVKSVSTTPCGHLFCWSCILEWLQSQNKCPLCREIVIPSRIVPLLNY